MSSDKVGMAVRNIRGLLQVFVALPCTVVATLGLVSPAFGQRTSSASGLSLAPEEQAGRDSGSASAAEGRAGLRGAVVAPAQGSVGTYVCGDLHLTPRLAFVGCGTGSGFLYSGQNRSQSGELAHFRLGWTALELPALQLVVGAGLAEAELGADRVGFVFSPGGDAPSPEAAGAEFALGVDVPVRVALAHLRVRVDAGAAWIPGLPTIGGPSTLVPFALFTANGRF